jgi:peptidoglycan L-alanyl-D-glutamate endopeptidase CwlK
VNQLSLSRLNLVVPPLRGLIQRLADKLLAAGIDVEVVQALRDTATQERLFAIGRTHFGGIWHVTPPPPIVTRCPPGYSWHEFGMAADVAPSLHASPPFAPDWNPAHPAWKQIEQTARDLGAVTGADFRTFPDAPHIQLTGLLPINPDDATRAAYARDGIHAVWLLSGLILDSPRPTTPESASPPEATPTTTA